MLRELIKRLDDTSARVSPLQRGVFDDSYTGVRAFVACLGCACACACVRVLVRADVRVLVRVRVYVHVLVCACARVRSDGGCVIDVSRLCLLCVGVLTFCVYLDVCVNRSVVCACRCV